MRSYICSNYLGADIMSFDEYFRIDLLNASSRAYLTWAMRFIQDNLNAIIVNTNESAIKVARPLSYSINL